VKVFISWSGDEARAFALFLRDWLRGVIQAVKPFMSDEDIAKGTRNMLELGRELEESQFGIVVLTKQNLHAPWINFEAGAISKSVGRGKLVPLLLDVRKSDVVGPLAQFQAADASDRPDVDRLIQEINRSLAEPLEPDILTNAINNAWEGFATAVADIHQRSAGHSSDGARRPDREVLDEILLIARDVRRSLNAAESPGARPVSPPGPPAGGERQRPFVTWQDELRVLDGELAAGRVSADDYRRQRDDILSRATEAGR